MINMRKSLLFIVFGLLLVSKLIPQSNALGLEKWEYALENTGDILQISLPISAGVISVFKIKMTFML